MAFKGLGFSKEILEFYRYFNISILFHTSLNPKQMCHLSYYQSFHLTLKNAYRDRHQLQIKKSSAFRLPHNNRTPKPQVMPMTILASDNNIPSLCKHKRTSSCEYILCIWLKQQPLEPSTNKKEHHNNIKSLNGSNWGRIDMTT